METVLEQVKQSLEVAMANVESRCQQQLDEQKAHYESRIDSLEKELGELRLYKDVSLVNKLTVQVDQLQTENTQLKKRLRNGNLGAQSIYSASTLPLPKVKPTTQAPVAAPSHNETPAKVHITVQPKHPEPKPETEQQVQEEQEQVQEEQVQEEQEQTHEEEQEQEQTHEEEQEQEQTHEEEQEQVHEQEQTHEEEEQEPDPDLFLVDNLVSGKYFWEPESGNLYERLSDEEAGEVVGKIKTIKVRDRYYYQDTIDNHVYEYVEDTGDIGEKCGRIVNGKFVKN